MKKSVLMSNALLAVSGLFAKYAAMGAKIDTQAADYKSVSQAVNEALAAEEEKEILPEVVAPVVVSQIDQIKLVQDLKIAVFDAMNDLVEQQKTAMTAPPMPVPTTEQEPAQEPATAPAETAAPAAPAA